MTTTSSAPPGALGDPTSAEAATPSPPASPKLGYQPALDGIRGIAILAAMLFHADISWAVGGYLGVDAFFVLSGFLITSLLLTEWNRSKRRPRSRGKIDLGAFYGRRIRRLFPAFALMMVGVGLYCAFVAAPSELNTIRGDAFSALAYVGNWRAMAAPQGYFAQLHAPSPLLHTWSLAVEEQWYLIWPLVMFGLLMLRLRLRTLLAVVVGLAAVSTVLMFLQYHGGSVSRVYYGTDTRAQELLIGTALGVLFTIYGYARTRAGRVAVHTGGAIALLALAWAWVSVRGTTPGLSRGGLGFIALGVALVIASAIQPGFNPLRTALSWKPLCWVGLISYGLYLWHWPVYVWLTPDRTGIDGTLPLLVLRWSVIFAIATASYYLVEMPIRHQTWRMPRISIMVPATTVVLVGMTFAVTAAASSDPFSSLERAVAQSKRPPTASGAQTVGTDDATSPVDLSLPARVVGRTPRIYLVGDSVAVSLGVGMATVTAPGEVWNQGVLGCGLGAADLSVPAPVTGARCAAARHDWDANAESWDADVVLVSTNVWDTYDRAGPWGIVRFGTPEYDKWYLSQLQSFVDPLSKHGIAVAVLTAPCIDRSRYTLQDRGEPWTSFELSRLGHLNELFAKFADRNPGKVTLVDLNEYVCPAGNPIETVGGEDVRTDGVHFTTPGSAWVSRWILPQIVKTTLG